jgi:membrane-associated protease RseP (regulator of RpoE activity)
MIILLLTVAIAIVLFYLILELDISGTYKFLLVFLEMIAVSQIFIRRYKLPSELGLVLLKSKKGIKIIDSLAKKRSGFFNFFSDVGNSIAYGALSLIMMRRMSLTAFIVGLVFLAVLVVLVAPTAFVFLSNLLKLGTADKSLSSVAENFDFGLLFLGLILLLGGLFLFILFGILLYGAIILADIYNAIFLGTEVSATPGGTFLIPGINLPLFEGIIALVVVLLVHEGAHAVLARIGKVPILSSGIALFGIIPVGAFVEPDEKKLAKLDEVKQTRVLVAGSTSNLITSCIFFVIFAGFALFANAYGLIGLEYSFAFDVAGNALNLAMSPFRFVYLTLGLIFALNFVVGVVNLLPLPLFDGYRIVDVNVKNKNIVKALMYVTLAFFIVNFLPWLF